LISNWRKGETEREGGREDGYILLLKHNKSRIKDKLPTSETVTLGYTEQYLKLDKKKR